MSAEVLPGTREHAITDVLARRFSPRTFSSHQPSPQDLALLFTAAAWAPSAGNGQPWRFLVGRRGDDDWSRIFACLDAGNREWAHAAPILVVAAAQVIRKGSPLETGTYDLGQAVAHLTVQAGAIGLHVHQMAGFDKAAARLHFAIPDDHAPVTVIAIGALGSPGDLAEHLRRRELAPRSRRPLSETVFARSFGQPASWLP